MTRPTTILDAVVQVLKGEHRPRTVQEIYSVIVERSLYTFEAHDPVGVLRSTIRKHLRSAGGAGQPAARLRRVDSDRYLGGVE